MLGFFQKQNNQQQNQNQIQVSDESIKNSLKTMGQEGNLFISLYQFESSATGNKLFERQTREIRNHIIASEKYKKVRGIDSDISVVLYAEDSFDIESAITRALENTSVKEIIKESDVSGLYVFNLSLMFDFKVGNIIKIKKIFKDCSVIQSGGEIKIAFGKVDIVEKQYNISMLDAITDKAKEVLCVNPSDRDSFVRAILS